MSGLRLVREKSPSILLLALFAAQQPVSLNIVSPATPNMVKVLDTDYATVQLVVSVYLVAVAVIQIVGGALSDRFGRRPLILLGASLHLVGALASALAPSITTLIIARAIQGIGAGTIFSLTRAIIRDTTTKTEAARRIGHVMTVMTVVPMLAPTLGGYVDSLAGWRAVFGLLALLACTTLVSAILWLRETNLGRDPNASVKQLIAGFPKLLAEPRFRTCIFTLGATSSIFFSFLAAAPHVVQVHMGRSGEEFGLWFVAMALGFMAGNILVDRFVARVGPERMILFGTAITFAGQFVLVGAIAAFGWHPATLFLPMFVTTLGNGMTIPCASATALSIRPELAGSASGLAGSAQLGAGAIVSTLAATLVTSSSWYFVLLIGLCAAIGFLVSLLGGFGSVRPERAARGGELPPL